MSKDKLLAVLMMLWILIFGCEKEKDMNDPAKYPRNTEGLDDEGMKNIGTGAKCTLPKKTDIHPVGKLLKSFSKHYKETKGIKYKTAAEAGLLGLHCYKCGHLTLSCEKCGTKFSDGRDNVAIGTKDLTPPRDIVIGHKTGKNITDGRNHLKAKIKLLAEPDMSDFLNRPTGLYYHSPDTYQEVYDRRIINDMRDKINEIIEYLKPRNQ